MHLQYRQTASSSSSPSSRPRTCDASSLACQLGCRRRVCAGPSTTTTAPHGQANEWALLGIRRPSRTCQTPRRA
eukprot:9368671-Pyramimonas_sp.AAC.1